MGLTDFRETLWNDAFNVTQKNYSFRAKNETSK